MFWFEINNSIYPFIKKNNTCIIQFGKSNGKVKNQRNSYKYYVGAFNYMGIYLFIN